MSLLATRAVLKGFLAGCCISFVWAFSTEVWDAAAVCSLLGGAAALVLHRRSA